MPSLKIELTESVDHPGLFIGTAPWTREVLEGDWISVYWGLMALRGRDEPG